MSEHALLAFGMAGLQLQLGRAGEGAGLSYVGRAGRAICVLSEAVKSGQILVCATPSGSGQPQKDRSVEPAGAKWKGDSRHLLVHDFLTHTVCQKPEAPTTGNWGLAFG